LHLIFIFQCAGSNKPVEKNILPTETKRIIKNVTTNKTCNIRLWVIIKNESKLLDNISINPLNLVKTHLFTQPSPIASEHFTKKVKSSPKFESSTFEATVTLPTLTTRYKQNITTDTKSNSKPLTFETTATSLDLTTAFQGNS
jgi:hypothetical protein